MHLASEFTDFAANKPHFVFLFSCWNLGCLQFSVVMQLHLSRGDSSDYCNVSGIAGWYDMPMPDGFQSDGTTVFPRK